MQLNFCSALTLCPPHAHKHPISIPLAHRCRVSITIRTLEDCHATLVYPEPVSWTWNTIISVSPWDAFMLVFSPHNFSSLRFLESFFPWICWPRVLNKLFFHLAHPRWILYIIINTAPIGGTLLLLCLIFMSICASECVYLCWFCQLILLCLTVVAPWFPIYLLRDICGVIACDCVSCIHSLNESKGYCSFVWDTRHNNSEGVNDMLCVPIINKRVRCSGQQTVWQHTVSYWIGY